ncbi:MAG: hypothetical protein SNJ29_10030, partial [Rikenellaceae bacterium]
YLRILNGVADHLELCKFAYRLKNIGCSALKNAIMQSVKDPNDNVDQEWMPSIVSVFTSKEDCEFIAAAFDKYCLSKGIPKDIPYTDTQFESLFTNGYLLNIIKKIAAFEHDNATNDVCWVFERRPNISKNVFSELFKQISTKLGEMRGKTKDEISECVRFTLPFIRAISDRCLENELAELYSKLFSERGIPHANSTYARESRHDTKKRYLTECLSSEYDSIIDVISEFCVHIYRVTSNKVSTKSQLEALCKSKHKSIVNHSLITLLKGGFSISGLYSAILENNDYSNQDVVVLIKHCFSYRKKEDNSLIITTAQMTNKIDSMLGVVTQDGVEDLLLDIVSAPEAKQVVVDRIALKDANYINALPKSLMSLAIGAYNKDTKSSYSENYEYLKVVAKNGSNSQKNLVAEIATEVESNPTKVLNVLSELDGISSTKKSLVVSALKSYKEDNGAIDTAIESKLSEVIKKFS